MRINARDRFGDVWPIEVANPLTTTIKEFIVLLEEATGWPAERTALNCAGSLALSSETRTLQDLNMQDGDSVVILVIHMPPDADLPAPEPAPEPAPAAASLAAPLAPPVRRPGCLHYAVASVSVTLRNTGPFAVAVYWKGEHKGAGPLRPCVLALQPGSSFAVRTYEGHMFAVLEAAADSDSAAPAAEAAPADPAEVAGAVGQAEEHMAEHAQDCSYNQGVPYRVGMETHLRAHEANLMATAAAHAHAAAAAAAAPQVQLADALRVINVVSTYGGKQSVDIVSGAITDREKPPPLLASELVWPTDKRTDQFKRLDLDQLQHISEHLLKQPTYQYNSAMAKPDWKVGVVGIITARLAKIQAFNMPKLRSEAMNIGVSHTSNPTATSIEQGCS